MQQLLNPDTHANDARMRRSSFRGAFLFLEGESDAKVYGGFTDSAFCQIIVARNKESVIATCEILHRDLFAGFLGIVDADYDNLLGVTPPLKAILFTDWHDCECMMLRGAAFDKILRELASRQKLESWCSKYTCNLREHLLQESAKIGSLLLHSIKAGLSLKFSNLEVKEFVDPGSLRIIPISLVKHVKNKSSRQELPDQPLLDVVMTEKAITDDLWQIVRGHDLVAILGQALRSALGNCQAQDVTQDRLELYLRVAYPSQEFVITKLFQNIQNWEQQNPQFHILAPSMRKDKQ
jgi:hypothetical protein